MVRGEGERSAKHYSLGRRGRRRVHSLALSAPPFTLTCRYGPLLIMAIRMLEDLLQFLALALFVIISFGAAFYVLFSGKESPQNPNLNPNPNPNPNSSFGTAFYILFSGAAFGQHKSTATYHTLFSGAAAIVGRHNDDQLQFASVIVLLLEGAMDGEPDRTLTLTLTLNPQPSPSP